MMRNAHGEPVKLSVFVGSPKRGLEHIRNAIISAISEAGHIPDGMELWAAATRPTLKTIAQKLALCDVHVVILGATYGALLQNDKISFTEWEYRQSRAAQRPVISFLLEEDAVKKAWRKKPPSMTEKRSYQRFREELRRRSVCKLYSEPEMPNIGQHVTNAVNDVIDGPDLQPLAGWVRASSKAAKLASALQGNDFLMRVMDRVVNFRAPGSRMEKERYAKNAAAETFWDVMTNRLERAGCKGIFLESGSSLAYVSQVLEARSQRQLKWEIGTNNALVLLQQMLFMDGNVHRNPPVAPDPRDRYGAIFTQKCLDAYEEPPIKPRRLHKKELEAIDEVIELLHLGGRDQVILATASGWDTTHAQRYFRGPHVGSHANMLFKRAIFMTGLPVVLFLTRRKLDPTCFEARFKCRTDGESMDPETRYCYPVFGRELPLERALVETPVALCVGYEKESDSRRIELSETRAALRELLRGELQSVGFDFDYGAKEFDFDGSWQSGAIMVANQKFQRLFTK
jgi:Domain of unknown function (DUF4062)